MSTAEKLDLLKQLSAALGAAIVNPLLEPFGKADFALLDFDLTAPGLGYYVSNTCDHKAAAGLRELVQGMQANPHRGRQYRAAAGPGPILIDLAAIKHGEIMETTGDPTSMEKALIKIATAISRALAALFGRTRFALLVFDPTDPGLGYYLSNADREGMLIALRDALDRLESGDVRPFNSDVTIH